MTACAQNSETKTKSNPNTSPNSCLSDSDCICGGFDKKTDSCFIGNKEYYNKYVDKKKNCPDFCSGIAGNMVAKCVDNTCRQMLGCINDAECKSTEICINNKCMGSSKSNSKEKSTTLTSECKLNSDCTIGGCSGTVCESKNAEQQLTTCQYLPEFKCYKTITCSCVNGLCDWQKTTKFNNCIKEAKGEW